MILKFLAPYLLPAGGAVLVFALLFGGSQMWLKNRAKAQVVELKMMIANERLAAQAAALKAQQENAKITATRILRYQENSDASEIRAKAARVDAVVATTALERMRRRAADAVAGSCSASGNSAAPSKNGAEAGRVCAELLGRLGDAARRISQFADESANDDETCRADHAALKLGLQPMKDIANRP